MKQTAAARQRRVRRRHRTPITATAYTDAFAPASVSGLVAWYDFSDASTLYTDAGTTRVSADGDAIYQVNDKSGNANNLTQTTAADRPQFKTGILAGRPLARFDATSDFLSTPTSLAHKHFFVVVKYSAATFASYDGLLTGATAAGADVILIGDGAGGQTIFLNEAITTIYRKNGGAATAEAAMAGPINAFAICDISQAAGWSLALQVGKDRTFAGRFWNGDVAEVLSYNAVLSTSNHDLVGTYLAYKYGLTWVNIV